MSEELITAIKQRVAAGQTKEEIIQAVLAMGHTQEVAEAAYTLAAHDQEVGKNSSFRLSARALFVGGWKFAKQHPRLTIVSTLPLIAEIFLTAARDGELGTVGVYAIPLMIASVVAALAYVFLLMVILMRLTEPQTPLSLNTAVTFVKKHFLALCVIYLFSGLIILGGFVFFLLPGLAVMVSISFAQYAYLYEGKRGLSSLLRSAALVRGRFWYLVYKIIAFIILTFIPLLGLTIIFAIVESISKHTAVNLLNESLLQLGTAVLTVINLHAMNSVYHSLKEHDIQLEGKLFPKVRYILMLISGVGAIALIALAVAFAESLDFLDEIPVIETASGVQEQVSATALLANRYAADNNQSYEGVCESLINSVTEGEDIQCNDNGEGWALSATDANGTLWCADKSTPAKQIQTSLEDRIECFAL